MKLNVSLDDLDTSACYQGVLKIEISSTLVNFFKPSKTSPPLTPGPAFKSRDPLGNASMCERETNPTLRYFRGLMTAVRMTFEN